LALSLALVAVGAAVALLTWRRGGAPAVRVQSSPSSMHAGWSVYGDEEGWSAQYPSNWQVEQVQEGCGGRGFHGAVFSNVRYVFRVPKPCPGPLWDMSGLPRNAVVVDFLRADVPVQGLGAGVTFPLSVEEGWITLKGDRNTFDGPEPLRFVLKWAQGSTGGAYGLRMWFGPFGLSG
jgi:hypothetical protein